MMTFRCILNNTSPNFAALREELFFSLFVKDLSLSSLSVREERIGNTLQKSKSKEIYTRQDKILLPTNSTSIYLKFLYILCNMQ